MRRRIQRDPETDPIEVLRGEWWEDRKAELAGMSRTQLVRELVEAGVRIPDGPTLLWLRNRLAYVGQVAFYLDRGIQVPASIVEAGKALDTKGLPTWWPNIFYGEAE